MLSEFKAHIEQNFPELRHSNVYLAISGGVDSMVLSHLLLQAGIEHTLLHCNFQLRIPDSDLDEAFLVDYTNQFNLKMHKVKFNTEQEIKQTGTTVQETARKLRYTWFQSFLKGDESIILTAHHADDLLGTFFINLMRGTSLVGLTGIPEKREGFIRPLLPFPKQEIINYATDNGIKYREDQSNFENKYLRNKLRNELIPTFEQETGNFKSKVAGTIQSLKQAHEWINDQSDIFKTLHFRTEKENVLIDKQKLSNQPPFFLEYLLRDFGVNRNRITEFIQFLNAQTGAAFSTENFIFHLESGQIRVISSLEKLISPDTQSITKLPYTYSFSDQIIKCYLSSEIEDFTISDILQADADKIEFPLTIRKWQNGDRIVPFGMKGRKLISDILIDKKVPLFRKQHTLVLTDASGRLVMLIGHLISEEVKLTENTSKVLCIKYIQD